MGPCANIRFRRIKEAVDANTLLGFQVRFH